MEIVTIPHPALRKVSTPIETSDLGSKTFIQLLADMSTALATRDDGVGLSAPQIAVNKRVFVVSGKVFNKDWPARTESARSGGLNDKKTKGVMPPDEYFINPVVIKTSKKLAVAEEGCLSIPKMYGMVKRPATVSIEYINVSGEMKTKKATGLLARIFQHEIDHLDGILFTDKATDVKEMKDDERNQEL